MRRSDAREDRERLHHYQMRPPQGLQLHDPRKSVREASTNACTSHTHLQLKQFAISAASMSLRTKTLPANLGFQLQRLPRCAARRVYSTTHLAALLPVCR